MRLMGSKDLPNGTQPGRWEEEGEGHGCAELRGLEGKRDILISEPRGFRKAMQLKFHSFFCKGQHHRSLVSQWLGGGPGRTALPSLVINSTTRHEHPGLS